MIERIGSKVIYGPKTTPQEKECTDIAVCWPRWQQCNPLIDLTYIVEEDKVIEFEVL